MSEPNFPPYKKEKLSRLTGYAANSRTHSTEQIKQIADSITEFGFTNPILVDENGMIIAGHGRLAAAQLLGINEVPTITLAGLTEAQKRAYVIADNKLALNAGWDLGLLKSELGALKSDDFDLSLTGFSSLELADLFAEKTTGLTDPDELPEADEDSVSVIGDVWVLGAHRIACGDCTDALVVDSVLAGVKPHLMVTDPPYGVKYEADWRTKAGLQDAGAHGKVLNDDRADWREAWALFPGNVAYIWHGALHAQTVSESLASVKFKVRAQIIWVKTRFAIGRGNYHWQHEPSFYATKEGDLDDGWRFVDDHESAAYVVKDGKTANWEGGRKQSTVWFIEHIKSETGHSTQKPVECMARPIRNNSSPGQAVYEPFSGSGTTIIACEMEGRACYAVELNPPYVDMAIKRWQNFTGKQAVRESDGVTFDEALKDHGKSSA